MKTIKKEHGTAKWKSKNNIKNKRIQNELVIGEQGYGITYTFIKPTTINSEYLITEPKPLTGDD